MIKKIFLILLFFCFLTSTVFAKDTPQVLFINQVRGEECCAKGTFDNLKSQTEKFITEKIPGYFALRYDVLTDEKYVEYLKQLIIKYPALINLGLMIEITPQLAKDSRVTYHNPESQWFEGQNIFTIGYQVNDRKKLIDQLFSIFKNKFGHYPNFTSAWMIDTDSLNYIHEKYEVIVHQITREQWGTDSYSLYGGPPHYPYPASTNWLFIPDFQQKNPVLILRQTVIDPLYNYGETKKTYTSQPNDYIFSGLDFIYFKKLINQALFEQKTTGFALLGLETSMDEKFQQEYFRQIEYIAQLKKKVSYPDLKELNNYWKQQTDTFYQGKDLINNTKNTAEFETTANFRKRIRTIEDKTYVTDYRYFDQKMTDPYNGYIAKKMGYWVVPFALDYSHIYNKNNIFPETINDIKIEKQPDYKIEKFDAIKFNQNRMMNYPYFLPEPIEREINRQKSQVKIVVEKDIKIELSAKDKFGWPVTISSPVEININPQQKEIKYKKDLANHTFTIPNNKLLFLKISLSANKKTIKNIYLFPRFLLFLKIIL